MISLLNISPPLLDAFSCFFSLDTSQHCTLPFLFSNLLTSTSHSRWALFLLGGKYWLMFGNVSRGWTRSMNRGRRKKSGWWHAPCSVFIDVHFSFSQHIFLQRLEKPVTICARLFHIQDHSCDSGSYNQTHSRNGWILLLLELPGELSFHCI